MDGYRPNVEASDGYLYIDHESGPAVSADRGSIDLVALSLLVAPGLLLTGAALFPAGFRAWLLHVLATVVLWVVGAVVIAGSFVVWRLLLAMADRMDREHRVASRLAELSLSLRPLEDR